MVPWPVSDYIGILDILVTAVVFLTFPPRKLPPPALTRPCKAAHKSGHVWCRYLLQHTALLYKIRFENFLILIDQAGWFHESFRFTLDIALLAIFNTKGEGLCKINKKLMDKSSCTFAKKTMRNRKHSTEPFRYNIDTLH